MVASPSDCRQSPYGPRAVMLTDEEGEELSPTPDNPSFYGQQIVSGGTVKFYTDHDGSKNFSLVNLNLKASAEVELTVAWKWTIRGDDGEKYAYSMSLTGTQAKNGVNTAYAWIEDIPPGTISYLEITRAADGGDPCYVDVNVMWRYQA